MGMIPALLGRHPGAVLGVFLLAFSLFFGDTVMTGVQFSGSGALYAAEAERTLEECGVRPFTFFAAYDRDELERLLLKNPHFSVRLREEGGEPPRGGTRPRGRGDAAVRRKKGARLSGCGGDRIRQALSGSALVAPGDRVERGALLIEGKVLSGEEELEVSVLGEVGILVTDTAKIYAENEEDARALFLARTDRDYITVTVKKTEDGFEAAGVYRRVLYGGKD